MPFDAIIWDRNVSYSVGGIAPLNILFVNRSSSVSVVVIRTSSSPGFLNLEVAKAAPTFSGSPTVKVVRTASTSAAFGVLTAQVEGGVPTLPPRANPDVRFVVRAPAGVGFSGQVEDRQNSYEVSSVVPTVFLFENPNGPVDAQLTEFTTFAGPLVVDLLVNGKLAATASGSPGVIIKD